ncbi:MAG: hypothetical protein IPI30_06820 [Saprospiraceae bacterium]|nr:hypothetical protein [Candidatus Vicinibacter affinis]
MNIHPDFKIMMDEILGDEFDSFANALNEKPPISIRLNPLKPQNNFNLIQKVPWASHAYYLEEKPIYTLDPYFHAGHYYPQEASSMVIESIVKQLPLPPSPNILDACAAPGGKSTHLSSLFPLTSLIHSHEFNSHRSEILRQNIEKWAYPNCLVSYGPLQNLSKSGVKYDLILIDAPCSGEGMFRKEKEASTQWNRKKIEGCVSMQKEILKSMADLLADGGFIIYSTCTFNKLENEDRISNFISDGNFESIKITEIDGIDLISSHENNVHVYKSFPHRNKGEGFSFSILKKHGNKPDKEHHTKAWAHKKDLPLKGSEFLDLPFDSSTIIHQSTPSIIPSHLEDSILKIYESGLRIRHIGIPLGHYKGKDWFPAHGLSQSPFLNSNLTFVNLEKNVALDYLRANQYLLPEANSVQVWQIARFEESNLGWLKQINGKFKNYLPKEIRIHSL